MTITGCAPAGPRSTGAPGLAQTRKIRHQNENDDDDREDALHQSDEIPVGLLMGGVIVARGSRVLDFTVVGHFKFLQARAGRSRT